MCWRLCDGQTLRMLSGDDESVVFNDRSGETHLLNAMAVSLLEHLRQGPDAMPGLRARLAQDWEFDTDSEASAVLVSLTDELAEIGLIEPCQP